MTDLLFSFCQWLESLSLPTWVRYTLWGYPYVQLIHYSGLSLWVGTIVVLDLRLLGLAGRGHSVAQLANQLFFWTWAGLGIAVTGGFLLFASIATTYFHNPAFQIKLPLILLGVILHIVIQRKVARWDQSPTPPGQAKLAGLIELALWIGVVVVAVEIPTH